jgi:hypothetical protein
MLRYPTFAQCGREFIMATYKTAPRVDYDLSFQDVAQRLFDLASNRLVHGLAVKEKGSYSLRPKNRLQETVVKILIFQRAFGVQMRGELPWRDDGVMCWCARTASLEM